MNDTITVKNYGDMIAKINNMDLVEYITEDRYQGEYLAVCKFDNRLFYYKGDFGSCSGCDWLEDIGDYRYSNEAYGVPIQEAVNYVGDLKPTYVVPEDRPLIFKIDEEGDITLT